MCSPSPSSAADVSTEDDGANLSIDGTSCYRRRCHTAVQISYVIESPRARDDAINGFAGWG